MRPASCREASIGLLLRDFQREGGLPGFLKNGSTWRFHRRYPRMDGLFMFISSKIHENDGWMMARGLQMMDMHRDSL